MKFIRHTSYLSIGRAAKLHGLQLHNTFYSLNFSVRVDGKTIELHVFYLQHPHSRNWVYRPSVAFEIHCPPKDAIINGVLFRSPRKP